MSVLKALDFLARSRRSSRHGTHMDHIDGLEFVIGDFDAGGVRVAIEFPTRFEAGLGCGCGDQLDD